MYHDFLPLQKQILSEGSNVIPGIADAVQTLRHWGLKIGSSTGYTRELMEIVCPIAASQGYQPDVTLCSDDVIAGRPAPWLNLRACRTAQCLAGRADSCGGRHSCRHSGRKKAQEC
jgi:phosphonoacetaldehyde hydrolase